MTLPSDISMWEAVAALQVMQAVGEKAISFNPTTTEVTDLWVAGDSFELYDFNLDDLSADSLAFSDAYRLMDTTQQPYVGVLAAASGHVGLEIKVPQFPGIVPVPSKSIVVCPFAPRPELALPETVWRAVVHFLRSYGVRVYLLGVKGQYQDECGYTEDSILSEYTMAEKLSMLAGAELIVGVPNEWTWAATYWTKKLIYLYPSSVPPRRWFPYADNNYGRAVYDPHAIQVPVIINQLRLLIAQL